MTPSRVSARAAIGAAMLAGAAVLPGCGSSSPQTGIVAEITSNLSVPGELADVLVRVTSGTGSMLYEQSFPLTAQQHALPLRVGVQPSGDGTAPIRIQAIGRLGPDVVVLMRSATLPFVSGRVVLLPLPLLAACVRVTCSQPAETCGENGACVPDTVNPTQLPPYHPGRAGGSGGRGGTSGSGGMSGSGGAAGTGGTGGLTGAGGRGGTGGSGGTGGTGGRGGTGGGGGAAGTGGTGGRGGTGGGGGAAGTGGTGGRGGTGGGGGAAGTGGTGGRGGTGGSGGSGGTGGTGGGGVTTLNNGLVGYWAFDQAGLSFPDYSGNANNLTSPTATAWTASGHAGAALDLVSAGDFVASTPGSASVNTITSAISIAGWIVPQGGTLRTIVSRVIGTGFWKLSLADTGAIRFTVGTMAAQAPSAVGDGSQWAHVAATFDGANVRLYVGGALVAQAVFGSVSLVGGPAGGGPGGYGIDVGGAFDNITATFAENYRGRVDELTIYSRALTPSEVDALARGTLPMRR